MRDAESLLDQVLAYAPAGLTAADVREAVGLADDTAVSALIDAYVAADALAALDQVTHLADAGRDMAQVAAQAEGEARRRLLASAADPIAARRLALILRTVAEAAGAGAREGRARLMLELLSVEPAFGAFPQTVAAEPVRDAIRSQRPASAPARAAASQPGSRTAGTPPARLQRPMTEATAVSTPARPPAPVAGSSAGDVGELRARWSEVIAHATPVIKPLLSECRPIAREGARLTLAFPEGRDFMRSRIAQRAGAIEALLTDMFGGSFAIECVASNLELEPLTVHQAIGAGPDDLEARALLEGVLKITGGELIDAPEVR